MSSKLNTASQPQPLEDVQGDDRWMSQVLILRYSYGNLKL
jgi:hypothetical protein